MVDGRKILIDRRAVAFVYQRNLHNFGTSDFVTLKTTTSGILTEKLPKF